jgi:hypothetical protein
MFFDKTLSLCGLEDFRYNRPRLNLAIGLVSAITLYSFIKLQYNKSNGSLTYFAIMEEKPSFD